MKKTIFFYLLLILATTGSYAQTKKVAVITFYIAKQIGINDFGSAAAIATVDKLADNPDFNMTPMLNSFHTQFFESYSKNFPFQLIPEEQVINNDTYKAFAPTGSTTTGVFKDNYNLPFDGYKVILPLAGRANEKKMLEIFNQCDGVMKVYIDFDLIKIGIIGKLGLVKVRAHANIDLFNKEGNKVFFVSEYAKSKESNPLVGGVPVMTPEKILPMCESALAQLMVDLQKDLPKMIKKADSKL